MSRAPTSLGDAADLGKQRTNTDVMTDACRISPNPLGFGVWPAHHEHAAGHHEVRVRTLEYWRRSAQASSACHATVTTGPEGRP